MTAPGPLGASAGPLLDTYDALLADLDGVVYLEDQPVAHAPDALQLVRSRGMRVCFVTNNAAHTPNDVVKRLESLGIAATTDEVVTSSMAAADLLRLQFPPGTTVLVVGGQGLWSAVEAVGLRPVSVASEDVMPAAVVQGWGPDVGWANLAEATVALRHGARWVATNVDRTLPSPRGPLPGSGSLIAAVQAATGRTPDAIAGKPHPPLYEAARERAHAERPLFVGDRLDTDIAGATGAGLPSLFVLSGVSRPIDLLGAPVEQRPTYLGPDLTALSAVHPRVDPDGTVHRIPGEPDDGLDALRSLAARAWSGAVPPDQYHAALTTLDLE